LKIFFFFSLFFKVEGLTDQSDRIVSMEEKVARAIVEEDVKSLSTLISKGFEINQGYKEPIGCVRLIHDSS
jgi:hypothetical protein